MHHTLRPLAALLFALPFAGCQATGAKPAKDTEFPERMRWFADAKSGLFIHWGLYSIPAGVYEPKPLSKRNGKGHAEWYLASQQIATVGNNAAFQIATTLPASPAASALSLTATDDDGNTSEIGPCFPVDRIFANGLD